MLIIILKMEMLIQSFLDPDFIELMITMDTSDDGTIEITIPRDLLDAKFESSDDIFFVLVDGFETDYAEN